jgi:D-tyrosyl-tRNA(Tyr) deacylase
MGRRSIRKAGRTMIALLQRVSEAAVHVNGERVGGIGPGVLALIGVERGDSEPQADRLLERMLAYRIFPDGEGRMNLDVRQAGGGLLLVPQFTLAANTNKEGQRLFGYLVEQARDQMPAVATGRFGAHMRVALVNDGPVTFWLQVPPAA